MSVTLLNLETMTSYMLDESGVTGGIAGGADSAEAIQFINWAYKEVLRLLPDDSEASGVKTADISFVNGTELYSLPADFQALKRVECGWHLAADRRYPLWPVRYADRHLYYPLSADPDGGGYRFYLQLLDTTAVGGDTPSYTSKIGFVPIPATAKTNAVRMWYWPQGLVMDDATDTILPIVEDYSELIALKAARRIKAKAGLDFSVLLGQEKDVEAQFKSNMVRLQRAGPVTAGYVPDIWDNVGTEGEI